MTVFVRQAWKNCGIFNCTKFADFDEF